MEIRELYNKYIGYSNSTFPFAQFGGQVFGGGKDGEISINKTEWKNNSRPTNMRNIGTSEEITLIYFFNNVMLVGTCDGKIYRSVSPFTTFTKVLDMIGTNVWPLTWSVADNGSTVFISEYGAKGNDPNANGRRLYKSTDGGLTWAHCWTNPFETKSHIHKLLYDNYEDCLYVCTGDGTAYARIFKLSPPSYDTAEVIAEGIQPTGGVVFKDYMIWVQDIQPHGLIKQDKATKELELVLDLSQSEEYNDTGFDALKLSQDGKTLYFATFPSFEPSTMKVGLFKADAPFTDWKLLSSIDEFTNDKTTSVGVRHFYKVGEDEICGQFAWMPKPFGVRRTKSIKFVNYKNDLRQ